MLKWYIDITCLEIIKMDTFNKLYPKPQFNWYQKNDTYFDELNEWKEMKQVYVAYLNYQI